MKHHTNALLIHGAIGGMLAGLVVALCFLAIDLLTGGPFRTPAALASALTHHPVMPPTVPLIAAYSLVHFAVFTVLGMLAAWALAQLELGPALLFGVIFGIVVQETVFYAGLLLGGAPPSQVVPWRRVVFANVLSGIVLMAYLHRALRSENALGLAVLRRYPSLARGVLTGLVGAATVAVWFFMLDVVAGQPFRTAAALGSALFLGAMGPADVTINLGIVASYTAFHLAAFIAAGLVFVAFAEGIERAPSFLLLAIMAAIVLEAAAFTMVALGAQWVMGSLGVASIAIANILAVTSMGAYVWRTHPLLQHRLRDEAISLLV